MSSKSTFISSISKKEFPLFEKVSGVLIKDPILSLIQKEYPFFNSDSMLALSELNFFREQYITSYLEREINEISSIERKVIQSLKEEKSLVTEIEDAPDSRTYGQIVADKVADFGGSWTFIISFMFFLFGWIIINVVVLVDSDFAPEWLEPAATESLAVVFADVAEPLPSSSSAAAGLPLAPSFEAAAAAAEAALSFESFF